MATYPTDIPAVMAAMQSYSTAPSSIAGLLGSAMLRASPVDRMVETYDLLREVMTPSTPPEDPPEGEDPPELPVLDAAGLRLLAGCAEQIMLQNFHGRQSQALGVRDAAIARLEALV